MVLTNDEEKVLKAFVKEIKNAGKEIKKKDGIVREISWNNIIKKATKEE